MGKVLSLEAYKEAGSSIYSFIFIYHTSGLLRNHLLSLGPSFVSWTFVIFHFVLKGTLSSYFFV